MNEPPVPDHVKALYDRMQDAMLPLVQRHVVSIAAYYDGGLHQHATGTLVQFSGHHFVVTAAHAIEIYDKAKEADSATRSVRWRWLRYSTQPYPERDTLPETFDERFHMALCLGDDPQLPAQLEGISGCAIWRLSDTPVREDWCVEQAKVVAVETCVYRDRKLKAIRGTKWRWVGKVLVDMYPEIRESFRL